MRSGGGGTGALTWRTTAGAIGLALGAALPMAQPVQPAEAAPAAPAGPKACPESVLDRYEPGDEVTVVGYTAGCLAAGDVAAAAAGRPPIIGGYLHSDPCADVDLPYCTDHQGGPEPAEGTALGRFTLAEANDPVRGQRMQLTFRLPAGLASGLYYLVVCREPCAAAGTTVDAAGATPLYVGVDPPPAARPVRHWPLDDPAVGDVPDDALISPAEGQTVTGAEARALTGTEATDLDVETAAAASPAGDEEGWHPPSWWPGAALVLGTAAILANAAKPSRGRARGQARGRKQIRHPGTHP